MLRAPVVFQTQPQVLSWPKLTLPSSEHPRSVCLYISYVTYAIPCACFLLPSCVTSNKKPDFYCLIVPICKMSTIKALTAQVC